MSPISPECPPGGSGPEGFRDWEINQLCDFDGNDDLIATFLQIFVWDEDTGVLTITLVRADDPTIPYVPTGTVRSCSSDTVSVDNFPSSVEVSNDIGNPLPISGTVSVNNGAGAGAVNIQDGGNSITVDGTVAATQSGAWSVGLTNDPSKLEDSPSSSGDMGSFALGVRNDTSAVTTSADGDYSQLSVDSSGRQKVIIEGSLTIPVSGPLTDAQLRATAVPVSGTVSASEAKAEDSAATNGDNGIPMLAVRNDAAAAKTSADGDYSMIATDAAGRVGIADLGGSITIDGTVGLTNDPSKLEDSAAASGDRGDFVLGVRNDAAAVTTSADGDYSQISTDSAGRIGIADLGGSITVDGTVNIGSTASISGGLSTYKNLDLNATGQSIKGSAGQVYMLILTGLAGGQRYVKLYNTAAAPVVGTDIPIMTIPVNSAISSVVIDISTGAAFSLGIGIAATTGIADNNTGNPGVNTVTGIVGYK